MVNFVDDFTLEKAQTFCVALSESGIVARACAAINISRRTAYNWRNDIPEFKEAWEAAMQIGITTWEDEIRRRAFKGVEDPLVHQGQFTYEYARDEKGKVIYDESDEIHPGTNKPVMIPRIKLDDEGNPVKASVRKFSDVLAMFMLKAHDPDRYRESSNLHVTGELNVVERIQAARKRGS